jgi:hypothetical protein
MDAMRICFSSSADQGHARVILLMSTEEVVRFACP